MIGPPPDTPEYAYPMWAAALKNAVVRLGILESFQRDTRPKYKVPGSPLEALIDQATELDKKFAYDFARWFNKTIWGTWRREE